MKHLSEEQLIDVLMGEMASPPHLAECDTCRDELDTLRLGLEGAQMVKPQLPIMPVPLISYDKFRRRQRVSRQTWIAVAAMFFLAILGLRVELSQKNGLTIQFALFHQSNSHQQEIAALEARMLYEMNLQTAATKMDLTNTLDEFLVKSAEERNEITNTVATQLVGNRLLQSEQLKKVRDEMRQVQRNINARGTLQ